MNDIRTIYEKVCRGDSIADDELRYGRYYFTDLADQLRNLGPVFHLAYVEATRVQMQLDDFYLARRRKD